MLSSKVKIRPLKLSDSRQVEIFLEEVDVSVQSTFNLEHALKIKPDPFKMLHFYLPLQWKFMHETYLALENNEIIGLIGLVPDCKSKLRWKIDELFLKPNSYDVGKLLVDFIVNKYGAEGVENFLTEVNSTNSDALDLFKNACGFRYCTLNHTYKHTLNGKYPDRVDIANFRRVCSADNSKLYDLYLECLTPQTKMSLDKTARDFNFGIVSKITDKINGYYTTKWLLENPNNNSALALATMITNDFKTFQVYIITSLPYSEYYSTILDYITRYAGLKNMHSTLLITVSEAIQSHSKYIEILEEQKMEHVQTCNILVKDYWRPLKEARTLTTPSIILFPEGTSPACNSLNIVSHK